MTTLTIEDIVQSKLEESNLRVPFINMAYKEAGCYYTYQITPETFNLLVEYRYLIPCSKLDDTKIYVVSDCHFVNPNTKRNCFPSLADIRETPETVFLSFI